MSDHDERDDLDDAPRSAGADDPSSAAGSPPAAPGGDDPGAGEAPAASDAPEPEVFTEEEMPGLPEEPEEVAIPEAPEAEDAAAEPVAEDLPDEAPAEPSLEERVADELEAAVDEVAAETLAGIDGVAAPGVPDAATAPEETPEEAPDTSSSEVPERSGADAEEESLPPAPAEPLVPEPVSVREAPPEVPERAEAPPAPADVAEASPPETADGAGPTPPRRPWSRPLARVAAVIAGSRPVARVAAVIAGLREPARRLRGRLAPRTLLARLSRPGISLGSVVEVLRSRLKIVGLGALGLVVLATAAIVIPAASDGEAEERPQEEEVAQRPAGADTAEPAIPAATGPETRMPPGPERTVTEAPRTPADFIEWAERTAAGGDFEASLEILEEGLLRVPLSDPGLRARFFVRLARITERLGRGESARVFRQNAQRLAADATSPRPLLEAGLQALDAGDPLEARRLIHRFLLRADDAGEHREELVIQARRALARAWNLQWLEHVNGRPEVPSLPDLQFRRRSP